MSIKAVLFDLDGTLLPMNQDEFIQTYFVSLAKWLAKKGYEGDISKYPHGDFEALKYYLKNADDFR